ncbi:MAG: glutaredoxin family protein [Syntrophales bacterium]|nr:glutaredoxin family protein [Syntrophales bacterium]MDD5531426.1 glutaredoxin family protein [Syntrophales bacterium]HPL62131.1 glutaredoxin family protein [Syntrophales bacterium]
MKTKRVDGEDRGNVMLYALSTCGWCKKTKELLKAMNVGFQYTDVDQLGEKDRAEAMDEVRKWNPACSFPSMVIDDARCIVGFNEKEIREALGK